MHFLHAPGASANQLNVWIPDMAVFLCGDVISSEFPRLYSIGKFPRDATSWIKSLDRIRRLKPTVLIPSRGGVVTETSDIRDLVTNHRDAIQFVHDQTIRLANAGHHRDVISRVLELPSQLFSSGRLPKPRDPIDWSVKAVYDR